MKLYCSSCGVPNNYTVEKPNFCQKCGQPVAEGKSAQGSSIITESEEDRPETVPLISKLDFDMVGDIKPRGVTIAALSQISSDPIDPSVKPKKKKAPRISKKKVIEDFRKEAGTARPDNG